MTNLRQMGTAVTAYAGDYNGYLPSWIGMGGTDWIAREDGESGYRQCHSNVRDCLWKDGAGGINHRNAGNSYGQGRYPKNHWRAYYTDRHGDEIFTTGTAMFNYRVIGLSSRPRAEFPRNYRYHREGWEDGVYYPSLRVAPNGLGMLLDAGYLPDARLYYCPSSSGMLSNGYGGWSLEGANLIDWQGAGGFDVQTMRYGDWTYGVSQYGPWTPHDRRNSVQSISLTSHYSYRAVPLGLRAPWCAYYEGRHPNTQLMFTRPRQWAQFGSALFRTQRQLGGRALASDTFAKGSARDAFGNSMDSESLGISSPGDGISGHRTAYNVLYGDGSVATYNDPQEQIVWHPVGWGHGSSSSDPMWSTGVFARSLRNNYHLGGPFTEPARSGRENQGWRADGVKIWNDFDMAVGIDTMENEQ